jgi:hypothetical protein
MQETSDESIQVCIRIKPCSTSILSHTQTSLSISGKISPPPFICCVDPAGKKESREFSFDGIFGMDEGQEEVYERIRPLLEHALDGYNVCVFAYGQTASGKTFSMQGEEGALGVVWVLSLYHLCRFRASLSP